MTEEKIKAFIDGELSFVNSHEELKRVIDIMTGFNTALIFQHEYELVNISNAYWDIKFHEKLLEIK